MVSSNIKEIVDIARSFLGGDAIAIALEHRIFWSVVFVVSALIIGWKGTIK